MGEIRYWVCIIGPVEREELPDGADAPPRGAAIEATIGMIGRQPDHCYSGWSCNENKFNEIMDVWCKN
jgi:hypothetical protein